MKTNEERVVEGAATPPQEVVRSRFVSAEDLSALRMETQRQKWKNSQASLAASDSREALDVMTQSDMSVQELRHVTSMSASVEPCDFGSPPSSHTSLPIESLDIISSHDSVTFVQALDFSVTDPLKESVIPSNGSDSSVSRAVEVGPVSCSVPKVQREASDASSSRGTESVPRDDLTSPRGSDVSSSREDATSPRGSDALQRELDASSDVMSPPEDAETFYSASSEVSLCSEWSGGEGVLAGHVAAMRERFESMTRAATPDPLP